MKRRDLFKVAGITAIATLSACSSKSGLSSVTKVARDGKDLLPKGQKKRLVIVGGGIGGMALANIISHTQKNDVEVIVLEKNRRFHACPGSNILLTKKASEYVKESSATSTWIFDYNKKKNDFTILTGCEVLGGDLGAKVLHTTLGDIPYDTLAVSAGIEYAADRQFPTWDAGKLYRLFSETPAAMAADAGEQWCNMSDRWENLIVQAKSNPSKMFTYVINATPKTDLDGKKTLRRCPPAAGERTTVLASRIKKEGLKNLKIKFLIELDENLGSKGAAFKQSWEQLGYCKDITKPTYNDIIHPVFNARIKDIDFDKKVITYEQKRLNSDLDVIGADMKAIGYDEACIMVYQKTPQVVVNLFGSENVKLKPASFQVKGHKDHFLFGDSQTTHKLPPSGSMAMSIAGIMSGEIVHSLLGAQKAVDYTKAGNTCYSLVGESPNTAISVSHSFIIKDGIIKGKGNVPKDANGIYRARSIAEAQASWIYGIGALFGYNGTSDEKGVLGS